MDAMKKNRLIRWIRSIQPSRTFSSRKAALAVIWSSWLQILVTVVLAVMYFTGEPITTGVLMVILVPVVVLGNILLMRNSWVILSFEEEMAGLQSTLQGEAELNRRLRAQRHDFVNHLQVVYSLLQLGEHQEAETYLNRVYEDLRQAGRMLRTQNPAVNALLAAKSMQAEQRHIRLSFEIETRLDSPPMEDWEFCRILGNLIDNALDAAAGQQEPRVSVALWEELSALCFRVSNNGPPIPPELMHRIFEPGFTTKGDRGTGMGLYIVRTLMAKYDGAVDAGSDGSETRFTGRLPVQVRDAAVSGPNLQTDI